MTAPRILTGLNEIAERYDVLLCDVWGVIHNGRRSFPAACAALVRFQENGGTVVLISNSPRPAEAVVSQLDGLNVPRAAWSSFITSGDATRALLAARSPGPAWRIGPNRDDVLYEGLGLDFAGPEAAAFIACTGLIDDETETPEDYRAELALAAGRRLEMICANPDKMVHRGERLIYCGGALADLYEALDGKVIMAGKPYPAIYDLCRAEADRLLGRGGARLLCIGDGVHTDVKGAAQAGLDCLFVTGGVHGAETSGAAGAMDPAQVETLLAENGTRAAFAMPALCW